VAMDEERADGGKDYGRRRGVERLGVVLEWG
jgi:hypothetical protein